MNGGSGGLKAPALGAQTTRVSGYSAAAAASPTTQIHGPFHGHNNGH